MNPERSPIRPLLASAGIYAALTVVIGWRVLANLGTLIASDPGDPLLTASILSWNATHTPWTDAWYQFPIFHPTRDALALSEHLLGISVIAAPVQWLTGNAILAYNVTVLLSYPLCGLAMYALVWHLTKSGPAAFLAGIAYAFAPYRASHLPHIQMLMSFWMPVGLLGLHAYLETERWQWLALFALAWVLQGASNGYYLVYFTFLVALWTAWFLVARHRWRNTAAVGVAGLVAVLPLAPILYRYIATQRALGLSRGLGEINDFSADIAAVLCAPGDLVFWGWLRVACAAEGELFSGGALIALCVAGVWWGRRSASDRPGETARPGDAVSARTGGLRLWLLRVSLAVAFLYGVVTTWTLVMGPWSIDAPFRASSSSADKPASVTLFFLLIALVLSRRLHAFIRRGSTPSFYLVCAAVCWVLSWGPFPRFFGQTILYQAPYGWLLPLPGADSLRAPSRLWMMVVLCLIVFMGIVVARLLSARPRPTVRLITLVAACGLFADGWATIRAAEVPKPVGGRSLQDKAVLLLPAGEVHPDIAMVYHAVAEDFRSINGYSGYQPPYYEALRTLSEDADARLFAPFVNRGDVHVLVRRNETRLRELVARQPGAEVVADGSFLHYRVPQRAMPAVRTTPSGVKVPIHGVGSACSPERVPFVTDGSVDSGWTCGGSAPDQTVIIDFGRSVTVGAIVHAMGAAATFFPRHLVVESSLDGRSWTAAWEGSPAASALQAAMASPRDARILIEFPQRAARYLRLRQEIRGKDFIWVIAELEVWSGSVYWEDVFAQEIAADRQPAPP